jgi:hypothetical protein
MFDARTLLETQVGTQLALTWQQVVDVGHQLQVGVAQQAADCAAGHRGAKRGGKMGITCLSLQLKHAGSRNSSSCAHQQKPVQVWHLT